MRRVEWKIRDFRAAFFITPQFANWVRTRAWELRREGEPFEIIMCWGRRRFRVGELPPDDPYFAIERVDGSVERSPWIDAPPPIGALPALPSSELARRRQR